jgi:hypothetical protein
MDCELLSQLANGAAESVTPVVFGPQSPKDVLSPNFQVVLQNPNSNHLVGCVPKLCLRPPLDVTPFSPTVFAFKPDPESDEKTTVWGSGAWAFAAIAATSHAKSGFMNVVTHAAPLPSWLQDESARPHSLLQSASVSAPLAPQLSKRLSLLALDASTASLSLTQARSLNEAGNASEGLATRLVLGPIEQTIRRISFLSVNETNAARIEQVIRDAVSARMPGAKLDVQMQGPPQHPKCRLIVRITPPFEISGKRPTFTYDKPWNQQSTGQP